jgi:two-component system LytT family response regulator
MRRKYKTIIVDDERLARSELKRLLTEYSAIDIVAEAAGVKEALVQIDRFRPDLLFLDIQLRHESGFDLLEKIPSSIKIIFVTAYDKYALRAFEVNAVDYLLKPLEISRLNEAVSRLQTSQKPRQNAERTLSYDDNLFLTIGNRTMFLRINTIRCIYARGKYTEVRTSDERRGLVRKPISEWERRLPPQNFVRIHRSTIINFDRVQDIEKWFNYSYRVFLKGIEEPFIMSRRYAAVLKERLG